MTPEIIKILICSRVESVVKALRVENEQLYLRRLLKKIIWELNR